MFDFTKEIELDKKGYSLYRKLQIILYLGAFFLSIYLAYLVIFPNLFFTFSFLNPDSSKNTIVNPRLTNNIFPKKGKIEKEVLFNANLSEDYSKAKVNFVLNKKSPSFDAPVIYARKSYQNLFYPDGNPIGFKDGSLLKNSRDYYIISEGALRKFSNINVLLAMGYSQDNFQEISENDLQYNLAGQDINENDPYPDSTLFIIDDNYYILEDQTLKKFVSDNAFLSNYDSIQAIPKNITFLNNYPLSEDLMGFANGTIIAHDISAYIISGNEILPINNIRTFESKGFDWNDVINVGSDEIAIYTKGKLFTIDSPHPDGSILKTANDSSYYIISDFQKHLLPTEHIAFSWLRKNPIFVSEKSLQVEADCTPEKSIFNSNSYSCDIPLDIFENLIGTSYEFKLQSNGKIELDFININFKKNIDIKNFKSFFREIFIRIKQNYVPA
jgi:hypothetical protein